MDSGMNEIEICSRINMKTADNKLIINWIANQIDMFSEDWEIIE